MIHPLLGETKPDDTPPEVRLACYDVLLRNYYSPDYVMLAGFPGWMRYAGPREAVFHAQVRKNYGMTHFIVGRGPRWGGQPLRPVSTLTGSFRSSCPANSGSSPSSSTLSTTAGTCEGMASKKTCAHPLEHRVHLSGSELRRMLREGRMPPREFTRPEVAEILISASREVS